MRQSRKDCGGRERAAHVDDHNVGPELYRERIDLVAATDPERGTPKQEIRHIGPQPPRQGQQARRAETQAPESIETPQDGGGVGAASGQARGDWNPLPDCNVGTARRPAEALQCESGSQGEIPLVHRQTGIVALQTDRSWPWRQPNVVVQVDGLKKGAQLVVAVCTLAEHLEAQVDLRERGHG